MYRSEVCEIVKTLILMDLYIILYLIRPYEKFGIWYKFLFQIIKRLLLVQQQCFYIILHKYCIKCILLDKYMYIIILLNHLL